MSERTLITGRVAAILNSRELVINRGELHGVRLGMKFGVLDQRGQSITDPETGDLLGSVLRPKVRIEIVRVEEKLAIGRTYETTFINTGGEFPDIAVGSLSGLSRAFAPPQWIEVPRTLKADEAIWEELEEKESFVKVNDPVEEIHE
jgi:hypothetical protein